MWDIKDLRRLNPGRRFGNRDLKREDREVKQFAKNYLEQVEQLFQMNDLQLEHSVEQS